MDNCLKYFSHLKHAKIINIIWFSLLHSSYMMMRYTRLAAVKTSH